MFEMLCYVYSVFNFLMYVQNCFIVEYDDVWCWVWFLYFVDQQDSFVVDFDCSYEEYEMLCSLIFVLLCYGQLLSGLLCELFVVDNDEFDLDWGLESLDWLGVLMLCEGCVCGVIVVQSYEYCVCYGEVDCVLLGYVVQYIQIVMDCCQVQVQLECQVEWCMLELQCVNCSLQDEVVEWCCVEKLQLVLFNIFEMVMSVFSLIEFYVQVYGVVGMLLDVCNFYIVLVNEGGDGLEFVYLVDEYNVFCVLCFFSEGFIEYIVCNCQLLLVMCDNIDVLCVVGVVCEFGVCLYCWLGVLLLSDDDVVGVIVVQSYLLDVSFIVYDQCLLMFVVQNIGNGLVCQCD